MHGDVASHLMSTLTAVSFFLPVVTVTNHQLTNLNNGEVAVSAICCQLVADSHSAMAGRFAR
jgi:hypothetical protein